jgi:trk system potassium uptake protein TrkH
MMFGSFFGLLIGRQFSLHQSLMLQDTLSHRTIGQVRQMVRFIVVATFVLEALGAALLYPMWPESVGGPWMRVYYSAFHAISAFCNAGFALHADSLIPYRHCWGVYVGIMPLIVVGGLGFPVLADLSAYARSRVRRRPLSRLRRPDDTTFLLGWSDAPVASGATVVMPRKHRLSLHTKAALTTSAILVAGGALLLLVSESAQRRSPEQKRQLTARAETGAVPPAMMDLPLAERALAALFQSVTARTAGFNTIALDVDSFSSAGHFVLCILMFVGGSPGSTAGGIKTITAFVIIMAVVSTLRGRDNVEAFRRAIPVVVLRRASVVLICMLALVCASTLLLSLTERVPLLEVLFESVSASGTVGLSTGLTARLTVLGKVIIMLTMFSGRLGPLTLLLAVTGGEAPARFDYPRESVVIG